MPSRWDASTRPLFVRTVWVSGARHAILTPDDPAKDFIRCPTTSARRRRRETRSAPAKCEEADVQLCLTNASFDLERNYDNDDNDDSFSDRVIQWLESSGKIGRPPTPFEGALWERPKPVDDLNVPAEPVKLTAKRLDLQLTCSGMGTSRGSHCLASTLHLTSTPPFENNHVTFKAQTSTSLPKTINPTTARPQLHIFMPEIVSRFDSSTLPNDLINSSGDLTCTIRGS
ncbi:unnamed protein product [Nesidiocoris tenuis]|uniref:Uncharacterized protein n=2 Tax=Nesidiocoris tenuis TaxID=355587 RepID=A0A6H5G7B2_9HEMI|nr:Hypothetical protein NTJ_00517 [Nesidiocoris tenuis]CAA9998660.1 unnamed protein product [Nesidiocoris tenuis]